MKEDLYKDRYDFEWNHRSHILGVTNVCIVAATIVGSSLVAEAQSFDYGSHYKILFISIWGLSVIALIAGLYFICRALIGYGYSHLATPGQLEKYYRQLKKWCEDNKLPEEKATEKLNDHILQKMSEAVEVNLENNKKKSAYNQKSIISVFISLLFLACSAPPYLLAKNGKEEVQQIEVVSPVIFNMENKK
jgi:hypothetical protein